MSVKITPLEVLIQAFPGLPETEAQELIADSKLNTYQPGTVLCQEDAIESTFYILLEGQVRVTKHFSEDEVRLLKVLEEGDFFGEMAIIHDAPRAASVTTTDRVIVLEITKDDFNKLLKRSASVARAMVQEVSRRLRENDAMAIEDLRVKAGELAAAYQKLTEQEYARREFLTTIAHELRTPLTAASGFVQMIQKSLLAGQSLDSEILQLALDSASKNLQLIVSLVNDILFVQEMDLILPRFKPTDINTVLESSVKSVKDFAADNKVILISEIYQGLPVIEGDAESLERAFYAILHNAIKFSPDGGEVQIRARKVNGTIKLEFQDHGVGIQPDVLPYIFDRFFHIDSIGEHLFGGVGQGLSIVRQVIEQHNGTIEVGSLPGAGTTFTIYLKLKEQPL